MKKKKVVLMILDGWGIGDRTKSDAVFNAHTPFMDDICKKNPCSQLLTDGENVGLPEGQMGNSEVGHLNIGAGRVVYQDLVKINKAIKNNELNHNPVLIEAINHAKSNKVALHYFGLVSEGGVHSSQKHLHALCDIAKENGLNDHVFVHAFTDGRDTDPRSGLGYLNNLENHLKNSSGELVSVIGRYYAMDRDKRWERIKLAYDLLIKGEGSKTDNVLAAVEKSYNDGTTDEFIQPIVKTDNSGNPVGRIQDGDVVVCFNFRTDRCREITMALTQQDFPEYNMEPVPLHYITMTNYDRRFKDVKVIFEKDNLSMTLGEVLASQGLRQIRIAETEKYPHVTFFFSGGREKEFPGESRIMINSPKVATYDLKPEMSAPEVAEAISKELKKGETDFVCLNFANADMVGHTGVYSAIVKAVETVDSCVKKVVEQGVESGYSFVIIADHGNADFAVNPDGSPNTAHSTNPVPCVLIDQDYQQIKDGILADIAPTILKIMNISKPEEMTGKSLV